MPIPDFQSVMRPILVTVAEGTPLALGELRKRITNEFQLSAASACLPVNRR